MDPVVPEAPDAVGITPQRYIRTYAGDIATVQRGGVPDLAPLAATHTPPPPSPVAPPLAPEPEPPSEPTVGAFPALNEEARVTEPPTTLRTETPPDALVTTYEQGMREATTR